MDERMPRIVVVTCRPTDDDVGWVLDVDFGPDVDIWAARAYLCEAVDILDECLGAADDND